MHLQSEHMVSWFNRCSLFGEVVPLFAIAIRAVLGGDAEGHRLTTLAFIGQCPLRTGASTRRRQLVIGAISAKLLAATGRITRSRQR